MKTNIIWIGTREEFDKIYVPFRDNTRLLKGKDKSRTFKDLDRRYKEWRKNPKSILVLYCIEDNEKKSEME